MWAYKMYQGPDVVEFDCIHATNIVINCRKIIIISKTISITKGEFNSTWNKTKINNIDIHLGIIKFDMKRTQTDEEISKI